MPINYEMKKIAKIEITGDSVDITLRGEEEETTEEMQPEGEMEAPEGAEETAGEPQEAYPMPTDSLSTDSIDFILDEDSFTSTEDGKSLIIADVPIAKAMVQTYEDTEGGVLKPASEIEAMAQFLDGTYITDGHPDTKDGRVTKREQIKGAASNSTFSDNTAFVDIRVDCPTLIADIKSGKKRQVSIGFKCDPLVNDEGEFEGAQYKFRQKGILVDHIAVVEKGRCSLADGCGIPPGLLADARAVVNAAKMKKVKQIRQLSPGKSESQLMKDSLSDLQKELKEVQEIIRDTTDAETLRIRKDKKDESRLTGRELIDKAYAKNG